MRPYLLLATVLLGACAQPRQAADPASGVTLSVEPTAPRPGARVTLTLRNGSAADVGYNLCTSGLERSAGSDWVEVPADRVCTMELRTLPPGGEDAFAIELPDTISAGEYRFHADVEEMAAGSRRVVRSAPFRVAP